MRIFLNDKPIDLKQSSTLSEFLASHVLVDGVYAVALNNTFIPQSSYSMLIQQDDHIDIIVPMQGG
jgi:thiamine biosynthesis protein ThiS